MTSPWDFRSAVRDVAICEDSRRELAEVMGRLERHAQPCGAKAVIATLTPLVTLYGVADRSEAEWTAFWKFFIDALEDLPLEALRAGVREYVENPKSDFFPRPGPLKALCAEKAVPIRKAVGRGRKALSIDPERAQYFDF